MRLKRTITLLILLITISGCNANNKDNKEIKTLDKAPDNLGEINKVISKILEDTGKIERISMDIDFGDEEEDTEMGSGNEQSESSQSEQPRVESTQESNEGGGDSEGNSGGDEESSHGGSESHGTEGSSTEGDKEEKNNKTWHDIEKSLEELYQNLLSYENDAIKKGASQERIVELKEAINKLVKAVEEKKVINIYDFGSESLLNLKPFYDLYKDDYRGEICELKHDIYQYYLKAVTGDKEGAKNQLATKDENVNRIRIIIGEDEKRIKELDKISTSLEGVGISLDEDSKRVLILEKDTLIKSLESLE